MTKSEVFFLLNRLDIKPHKGNYLLDLGELTDLINTGIQEDERVRTITAAGKGNPTGTAIKRAALSVLQRG